MRSTVRPRLIRRAVFMALLAVVVGAVVPLPAPAGSSWTPGPARYAVGATLNVPVEMADGTVLRADVFVPTDRQSGQPDVVGGQEAGLLVGELLVEGAPGHAGPPHHVRHRGGPVPLLRHHLRHGLDQPPPLGCGYGLAREPVPATG